MKSKITIEIDFENGNAPFIQVVNDRESLDVRDKLITAFIQKLGGTSFLCKVGFSNHLNQTLTVMNIYPITPQQIESDFYGISQFYSISDKGLKDKVYVSCPNSQFIKDAEKIEDFKKTGELK